ncbi:MAG: enoyl-CoA hydratase/isomerase family protein [Nitrospira sp. CR2.1]|nr:enoyl-CoA hydratase/isomerase family protein [Nitrospira sp. CR2.1]
MRRFATLMVESQGAMAKITLNRPQRRNAFDSLMVAELGQAFETLAQEPALRVVVLAAAGPVFCAGADIHWMQAESPVSEARARDDAQQLTRTIRTVDECPCPVIARVQGPAFGGGLGLLAACDMVVATEDATFALSETKLGLVPAIIAPFLLRKAGESFLRRYGLSGETFDAATARRFLLVHDIVPRHGLDVRIAELADAILRLAPRAVRESKDLFRRMSSLSDHDCRSLGVEVNASARREPEAAEGLSAFTDKRLPSWAQTSGRQPEEEAGTSDHGSLRHR